MVITSSAPRASWRRRLRAAVAQPDRRALEQAGWRTWLEYRENHLREADGTLVAVEVRWVAEAESSDGGVVASVTAPTADEAWARLRRAVRAAARPPAVGPVARSWCTGRRRPARPAD